MMALLAVRLFDWSEEGLVVTLIMSKDRLAR